MTKIPVLIDHTTSQPREGTLGLLDTKERILEVDADRLRRSLSEFSASMTEVLRDLKRVGEIPLKEVQLTVEVTAEGGVALIGTAKAGAKGAITLTFGL